MRVVVALGGNALLRRGEPMTAERQRANVRRAAVALQPIATEHELVISHGNGPQVGLLALQAESGLDAAHFPLNVLGAHDVKRAAAGLRSDPDSATQGATLGEICAPG